MAYADYTDANNKYLQSALSLTGQPVVLFGSAADFGPELESAERTIRAYLSGRVSSTAMNEWINPGATPEYIRELAAKLAAALRFRRLSVIDAGASGVSAYAQQLYDEAIASLTALQTGVIDLVEIGILDQNPTAELTDQNFWPNDSTATAAPDGTPGVAIWPLLPENSEAAKFTMRQMF